jgi:glycerophosphoryl diester phosphodiesterase
MKHFVIFYLLTVVICAAEPAAPPKGDTDSSPRSTWNARDHIPLEKFIIQSHRGAGGLAPENTIEAFELGWKLGTWPEADIRTTKDGVIVAFHDATFARVVKGANEDLKKKGVQDLTFAEIGKLDVGAWAGDKFQGRRVSKITEVFALMRGKPERHLYLDIKVVDLKKLADEVLASGVEKQVVLASPKPEQIREWKSFVPASETLLWMGGDEQSRRDRVAKLRKENFAGITQLQLHIRPINETGPVDSFTPSPEFILEVGPELRSRGILFQALPYTDDRAIYSKLLDLGLQSFSTDYPDTTLEEIRKYYNNPPSKR